MRLRTKCRSSPLPSQHLFLRLEKATGDVQENVGTLAAPREVRLSRTAKAEPGEDVFLQTLPPPLPSLLLWLPSLKFIGIIIYEKSVLSEDSRRWRWVADCNLMIRLKYAKANKQINK